MRREQRLRKHLGKTLIAIGLFCGAMAFSEGASADVYWIETFDTGPGFWSVDNGVWEFGVPSDSPKSCKGGKCVATILQGNYPPDTDSHLISPDIQLPWVAANGRIYLFFQQWFSYAACDVGYVRISTYDPATKKYSAWIDLGSISGEGRVWSRRRIDLTPYAGQLVQIAFYHTASSPYGCSGESTGWVIDNLSIETTTPFLCRKP